MSRPPPTSHVGFPKPFSRHVKRRTFRCCQCCIVRVLAFPKELGLNARPQTCSTKFLYSPFPSCFHLLSISPSVGFSGLTKKALFPQAGEPPGRRGARWGSTLTR